MNPTPASLLPRFLEIYPFQPATALWRAVEIAMLVESGLPQGRGLDLGCGDGLLTSLVLEVCGKRELVGIDPDPAEIELARASGLYRELHVARGDALPVPDGSIDWVLSNSVLEHIPEITPVLAEVSRVLRTGGECIFTVPSTDFHKLLRGPAGSSENGAARDEYLRQVDKRCAHVFYWDPARWKAELGRVGLELVEARPYMDQAQTRRWEAISRFTAGILVLAFRGRRRPIEIQRSLGMRKAGRRMPAALAALVSSTLAAGVNLASVWPPVGSGLLLRAKKRS
jgi:ubiquinone/menaquinone biosynthesis C-methylase UbiE